MDTQLGFINKMDVAAFREKLTDVETKIGGNTPLLVFDNHDNPRLDMRYGDGAHNTDIQRVISTVLFASRGARALLLRRRNRDEDYAPDAQGGCEGPGGRDRLAQRQGTRW